MDAPTFLGLEPTTDPLVWRMPVTPGVSTPGNFEEAHTWAIRPGVPGPEDCPVRDGLERFGGTIFERVEIRLAAGRQFARLDGTPGDGRSALWSRLPGQLEPSAAWLAVLGDYVPSGVAQALGVLGGGNSLDNTLRVVRLVPSEWVVCDIRIQAVANGFGHGLAHLWAEDGNLVATASQSVVFRLWTADRGLGTTQSVGQ